MTKADAMACTAADFQNEPRQVINAKKQKARADAYDKALAIHADVQRAYEAAEEAVADVGDGTDDNLVFQSSSTYTDVDVLGKDDAVVEIDDALHEVFQPDSQVEDFDQECGELASNYRFVT